MKAFWPEVPRDKSNFGDACLGPHSTASVRGISRRRAAIVGATVAARMRMKPPAAMSASVENDMTGKLNPSFAAMMTPPITVAAVPRMAAVTV